MDSSNWSDSRKQAAGSAYARGAARRRDDAAFRARLRREVTAADLSVAVAQSGATRAAIADKAGMKAAQLTRQLGGTVNLTLDSIGRICEAAGWDFDLVFRRCGSERAVQPWDRQGVNRTNVLEFIRGHEPHGSNEGQRSRARSVLGVPSMGTRAALDRGGQVGSVSVLEAA